MLRQLSIHNYALIDNLDIELADGLTILTGETGAGKSVMMGAISLLTGERADSKVLAGREGKAVVEGTFANVSEDLKETFDANDLDWNDATVIVRREISANGRSRAFVNDTPVTLPLLAEIAGGMVDIHSQHASRLLSQPDYQLKIIDSIAGNDELIAAYKEDFSHFVTLHSRIKRLRESMEKNRENAELRAFQFEQLSRLNPRKGELAEVEKLYDLLSDADDIRGRLTEASNAISQAEVSALSLLDDAAARLQGLDLTLFEPEGADASQSILERIGNLHIEIKDIGDTLAHIASGIESDPVRLAKTDARLKDLYDAVKRFKVKDFDQLVELYSSLKNEKAVGGENLELLNRLEAEAKCIGDRLRKNADAISRTRVDAAARFEKILTADASGLGLRNLQVEIKITRGKLTRSGRDSVEFLCSFNKNQPLMPLSQTASGGEMSRLALCIKAVIADNLKLPTVIFDEIDTGVSGDIADRMGSMMAEIAAGMQVLAITHLPQVAVKGDSHLLVYKEDNKERTVSNVRRLSKDERVQEIARMLSGKEINKAALANARTLLNNK